MLIQFFQLLLQLLQQILGGTLGSSLLPQQQPGVPSLPPAQATLPPAQTSLSPAPSISGNTALATAIYQNTPGNSQGQPVVISYDTGAIVEASAPPSDYSAMTAWAVVYQEAGASVAPNNASDTVTVANYTTYLHLIGGGWVQVQDQNQGGVGGANYIADFSNDTNIPFTYAVANGDGSYTMNAPPSGYNVHFWTQPRATFTPGTVDGIFTEAQMKTNDCSANLIVQFGADWWR